MNYKEFQPSIAASVIVERYWSNSFNPGDFPYGYDFIVPDGCADLVFMLSGQYRREELGKNLSSVVESCRLVLPFEHCVKVFQSYATKLFCVRLKPGGLFALTGVALSEFDKSVYVMEDILPELAEKVMGQVLNNLTEEHLVSVVDNYFSCLVERKKELLEQHKSVTHRFIKQSFKSRGKLNVIDFCSEHNLHRTTLKRKMKVVSGLSPKQFLNIIRFNYLLNHLYYSKKNLTELAYKLDYYDQSHMIKDFKKFTGMAPNTFMDGGFSVAKVAAISIQQRNEIYAI